MEKFNNYIFQSICEKSYELFSENSYFTTYLNFCDNLSDSIVLNNLNDKEKTMLADIVDYLILIYGMTYEETITYIFQFFLRKKYLIFMEPVIMIKSCFKNSMG